MTCRYRGAEASRPQGPFAADVTWLAQAAAPPVASTPETSSAAAAGMNHRVRIRTSGSLAAEPDISPVLRAEDDVCMTGPGRLAVARAEACSAEGGRDFLHEQVAVVLLAGHAAEGGVRDDELVRSGRPVPSHDVGHLTWGADDHRRSRLGLPLVAEPFLVRRQVQQRLGGDVDLVRVAAGLLAVRP